MYYFIVAAFIVVLPIASITVEVVHAGAALSATVVAKWFVFWAVGWRLFLAGVRQTLQPSFTAREILGLKGEESFVVVRELGFANISLGLLGLLSLLVPAWQLAAALTGGVFYGLAGAMHIRQAHRNGLENVAMVSDLFACLVLLGSCAGAFLTH